MKRNSFTFALVLSTLCFALLGNGCSENGASILGPEQITASDIPAGEGQMPFRNPDAPAKLDASWSDDAVKLQWSCDCSAVTFYRVYRMVDGGEATMVRATSFDSATDDLRQIDYRKVVYYVTGVDAYGNESEASNRIGFKKAAPDLPDAKNLDIDAEQQ